MVVPGIDTWVVPLVRKLCSLKTSALDELLANARGICNPSALSLVSPALKPVGLAKPSLTRSGSASKGGRAALPPSVRLGEESNGISNEIRRSHRRYEPEVGFDETRPEAGQSDEERVP